MANPYYIVNLEKQDLVLFPKERWCVANEVDPSYVYDITDFSEGVVKLFLEDQLPSIRLLVIPRLVEYGKQNNMTLQQTIDIARGLFIGSETDIADLWSGVPRRTDRLEPTIQFVNSIGQSNYEQIYKNIQEAFSLRDYVLYGIRKTTYPLVDMYNRMIPMVSIPVLYYKDSRGATVSKTNVRYDLRPDFNVDTHLTNLTNDSILGVLDVSGRYVYFLVYQADDNLTIETETLIGNEGYYCLSELQKFLQGFKWNIKDIRYKMSSFGSDRLPTGNPKEKKEKERLAKEREAVIRNTTSAIYSSLLNICVDEPLRYIFRPETTASTGPTVSRRMKFRIVENNPWVWSNYKGEAYIDIDDPESDVYEGGRMAFKLNKIGNVAISSVEAEKALGVDVRVDIETNLQDLVNTLSIIWYAFLKNGSELISKPVMDVSVRKEVYVLLRNTATGIIRRAAPFISVWKNKICNQDIMPYFYNGVLTAEHIKELESLEQSTKYKGYKYDRNTVYKYPNEAMLNRLKEKGYDLASEPINVLIPKGKDGGMYLKIRDAPRRLRDSFAGLTNNYAYLFDKTICITKKEKDQDESSTTTGYVLDSIKDEIPWEKNAEIDVGFLPSLGPISRTGVPESGYSSFLAVALVVLTEKLKRRPTVGELYKELKSFIKDMLTSDRKKYFLSLWKFFPGGGFTEFGDMIRKYEQDVAQIDETTLVDKSTMFMDSKIFSVGYGIYFDRNVITMEYVEKNNDIFEPLDMDRLCFAYPEIPNHITEDGLATEIFNTIDKNKSSVIILRRRYSNINSQYDAVIGYEKKSFDTGLVIEELKKLLFEMNFSTSIEKSTLNTDNVVNILAENGYHPLTIENMNVVGQFLDNTGRQTGLKVKIGKYELGLLFTRTRPIRKDVAILPLTEANNPYNIKKIIALLQENMPEMKLTHYSTVPIYITKEDFNGWMNLSCGFFFTIQGAEFFVPSALYEGVPTIFTNIPPRPSVYPYHMFSIPREGNMEIISKLYNRQISDGLVALILCAIRTTMIEKFLSGEWTSSTSYIDIAKKLLDEENEPEVVPLRAGESASRTGERYQEILNELRSEHRLPAKTTNGILASLRGKYKHYSLMFSKDNKVLLKGIAGETINNVKEISTRLRDQIRIMWRYIPHLLEGVNKRRMLDAIDKYGSAHPIYRVHLLEDDSYYSYRYEGCMFLNGEEMIRNHYVIVRKPHRTQHRLWTNVDTEHGPEFFLERGLGVHRITKTNTANHRLVQLSENDYPVSLVEVAENEISYQTREGVFFELSKI